MDVHSFRIRPGNDLKKEIEKYVEANNLDAASVVTCVGGLNSLVVRMPGATPDKQEEKSFEGDFEIVSLVGTLSREGSHLHISVSDKIGETYGGHLKPGSIVRVTAEVILLDSTDEVYKRKLDPETGFQEFDPQSK